MGSKHSGSGACASLNELADKQFWNNLKVLVPVLDAVREDLGHPVRLGSIFRNQRYNKCVRGDSKSQHLLFNAADCVGKGVENLRLYQSVLNVRRSGFFKGGVGLYGTFVHVDVRGVNVDWVDKSAIS